MVDGVRNKPASSLPGIFFTPRIVEPKPKQINRPLIRQEAHSLLESAKKFAETMPPDAANATLIGSTQLITLVKNTAAKFPTSKEDVARFKSLLAKLEKSLPTLAAAIQVRAKDTSDESKKQLVEFGFQTEAALQAIEQYERAAKIDPAKRTKLSMMLHEVLDLAPLAKNGGFALWQETTIGEAIETAARFRGHGRKDFAQALLRNVYGAKGSFSHELDACEEALRHHLEAGSKRAAIDALEQFQNAISWAKKEKLDVGPLDKWEQSAKELAGKVSELESRPPLKGGGSTHVEMIKNGLAQVPPDLRKFAQAILQHDRRQGALRWQIRELGEQIAKLPAKDPRRNELEAKRNAYLEELTKERKTETRIKQLATERMAELRTELMNKSPISPRDAELLASTPFMDKSIPRDERPSLRAMTRDFLRITGGVGIGTLQRFYREKDHPAASFGEIDVGPGLKRSAVFHELGHHFEYSHPKLYQAALDWLVARSTNKEAKPFAELFPDAPKACTDDQIGHADHFISYYVGRVYDHESSEVFSMGLEHFHDPAAMLQLLVRDPEHFGLIVGGIAEMRR